MQKFGTLFTTTLFSTFWFYTFVVLCFKYQKKLAAFPVTFIYIYAGAQTIFVGLYSSLHLWTAIGVRFLST